jgi:hypothetical protein
MFEKSIIELAYSFSSTIFVEGLAVLNDKMYILSWQNHRLFVLDLSTFVQWRRDGDLPMIQIIPSCPTAALTSLPFEILPLLKSYDRSPLPFDTLGLS